LTGELPINQYITHTFNSLDDVNKSIDILHNGDCLRAVIKINQAPSIKPLKI
jgi:Zn-dependent alcohol dehydrogenase